GKAVFISCVPDDSGRFYTVSYLNIGQPLQTSIPGHGSPPLPRTEGPPISVTRLSNWAALSLIWAPGIKRFTMDISVLPEVLLPAHMVVILALLWLKAHTEPEHT